MTRNFCTFGVALNALLFLITLNVWFLLGLVGFAVGVIAHIWLEQIQDRVVAELAKTCECPLCKANRPPKDEP